MQTRRERGSRIAVLFCLFFFVQVVFPTNVVSITNSVDALDADRTAAVRSVPHINLVQLFVPLTQNPQRDVGDKFYEVNKGEEDVLNVDEKLPDREDERGNKGNEIRDFKKGRHTDEKIADTENATSEADVMQNLTFIELEELADPTLKGKRTLTSPDAPERHIHDEKNDEELIVANRVQEDTEKGELNNNQKRKGEKGWRALLSGYTVFDLPKLFAEEYNEKEGGDIEIGGDDNEEEREEKQRLFNMQGFEFTYERRELPEKEKGYKKNFNENEQSSSSSSKEALQIDKYTENVEGNNEEKNEFIGEEQQGNVDQQQHFSVHRLYTVREISQICKFLGSKKNEADSSENSSSSNNSHEVINKGKNNGKKSTIDDTSGKMSIAECLGVGGKYKGNEKNENKGRLTYPPIMLSFQNSDDFAVIGDYEIYIYVAGEADDEQAAALLIHGTKRGGTPDSMHNNSQHPNGGNLSDRDDTRNSSGNEKKDKENVRGGTRNVSSLDVIIHAEMPSDKEKQISERSANGGNNESVRRRSDDKDNGNINYMKNSRSMYSSLSNQYYRSNLNNNSGYEYQSQNVADAGEEEGKETGEDNKGSTRLLQTRFGSTRASDTGAGIFFNQSHMNSQNNLTTQSMVGVLALNYPCKNTRLTCQSNNTAHRYGGMMGGHLRDQVERYGHSMGEDNPDGARRHASGGQNYHVTLNVIRSIHMA